MLGVPCSVNYQNRQVAAGFHSSQRSKSARYPAVDRDHPREPLGECQTQPVGQGSSLSTAHQENPLGMDMQQAASFSDGRENCLLQAIDVIGLGVEQRRCTISASDGMGFCLSPDRSCKLNSRPQPNPARPSRLITGSGPRNPRPT